MYSIQNLCSKELPLDYCRYSIASGEHSQLSTYCTYIQVVVVCTVPTYSYHLLYKALCIVHTCTVGDAHKVLHMHLFGHDLRSQAPSLPFVQSLTCQVNSSFFAFVFACRSPVGRASFLTAHKSHQYERTLRSKAMAHFVGSWLTVNVQLHLA